MANLNYFKISSGELHHENSLTHAYLTLLRLSPNSFFLFYSRCIDRLREREVAIAEDKRQASLLPGFIQLHTVVKYDIDSQTSYIPDFSSIMSVVITDEYVEIPIEITASDRRAIYDGVIQLSDGVEMPNLILVENKPDSGHIWLDQLNPAIGTDDERKEKIIRQVVDLRWRDIIRDLLQIAISDVLAFTEKHVIRDFVDYAQAHHAGLNPYDSFGMCQGNKDLMARHLYDTISEILTDKDALDYHHAWLPVIRTDTYRLPEIGFEVEKGDGELEVRLLCELGTSIGQAKHLYGWVNLDFSSLKELDASPYIRLGHFKGKWIMSLEELEIGVSEYVQYWKSKYHKLGKRDIPGMHLFLEELVSDGLLTKEEYANAKPTIIDKFQSKGFSLPTASISLYKKIPISIAIELEKKGQFRNYLGSLLAEALTAVDINPRDLIKAQYITLISEN